MSTWDDGNGRSFGVGALPGRKSIALYTIENGVLNVLAYFRSQEDAEECWRWLEWLAKARLAA